MSAMKRHLEDLGELAMMGRFVPVKSTGEAESVANYILACIMPSKEITDLDGIINQYSDDNPKHRNKVTHVGTYRTFDMIILSFLLDNDADEDDIEWKFIPHDNKNYPYRFSYAMNLTAPECSRLGDVCVLRNLDDTYVMVH